MTGRRCVFDGTPGGVHRAFTIVCDDRDAERSRPSQVRGPGFARPPRTPLVTTDRYPACSASRFDSIAASDDSPTVTFTTVPSVPT